ncbi:MAG: ferritin-like domain-containing protein [Myxococcales bacterium]|nr:ferritin-like domain-containing protein [Myxococcales bacterium]
MKTPRLHRLFQMVLATTALGARGSPCGTCPDETTQTIPLLPPSPGDASAIDTSSADTGADVLETEASADASDAVAATDTAMDTTVADTAPRPLGDVGVDACALYCPGARKCEGKTIPFDGGTIPAIECTESVSCGAGRRPRGLRPAATTLPMLTGLARLEAAAIDAFRVLRADLAAIGAPRSLLRAVSRARRDEVRHARIVGALAGIPRGRMQTFPAASAPDLPTLAADNAVEGQVRETFGALQALDLARTTRDPHLRDALRRIARDETRHAALAFAIDGHLARRLTPHERAHVAQRRRAAAEELVKEQPHLAGPLFAALGFV